ncbi:hypothetical protein [Pseudonocardia parietis]|uniref:Uncharacterized protein n=1 Tax=Pseudonocardia parietis TaxID=570936 RepID=A0ABS4W589_9PSEU|nr:hypothetical protein [Pseudonocardia parietis]MBP2371375.1 hypothetical protein [Pseudonocardia parietis]
MTRPRIVLVAPARQANARTPDRFEYDGRVLVTRAAICEEFAVGESTTRTWWRERATNGHPEPVYREGRRQWWDLEAMREFVEAVRSAAAQREQPPAMIEHEGHTLINRPGMAERYRLDPQWLAVLYHQRDANGHPDPVRRFERFLYFDLEETDAWNDEREAAKRSSLTPVDHRGEPDELVDITEATRVLGYTNESTIRSFLSRNRDYFPAPDQTDADGRAHWHRRTLWEFGNRRSRPGRAGHARTGG